MQKPDITAVADLTKDIFSLYEKKISALIVAFFFFCGVGAYIALTGEERDIPSNISGVLMTLITAIAGVNAIDNWLNNGKNTNQPLTVQRSASNQPLTGPYGTPENAQIPHENEQIPHENAQMPHENAQRPHENAQRPPDI